MSNFNSLASCSSAGVALGVRIACLATFLFALEMRVGWADDPRWIGNDSCSSATCHGGISGQGPAWNSSLRTWEATDFHHAGAGKLLLNDLSRNMVAALVGFAGTADKLPDIDFVSTLRQRCVSCHAPNVAVAGPAAERDEESWQLGLVAGVSCEACHGPASVWLESHTLVTWDSTNETARQQGFINNEVWLSRTDNCVRCHIGSRSADGLIRDMNHDLIAAGHPQLQFDMSHFQSRLPTHWKINPKMLLVDAPARVGQVDDKEAGAKPRNEMIAFEFPTVREHYAARMRTLAAAAKLSAERTAASSNTRDVPQPEFAEYNCYQCHQSIRLPEVQNEAAVKDSGQRLNSRAPLWNGHYVTENFAKDSFVTAKLVADKLLSDMPKKKEEVLSLFRYPLASGLANKIHEIANARAEAIMSEKDIELLSLNQELSAENPRHGHSNWPQITNWTWTNRVLLMNARVGLFQKALAVDKLDALLGRIELALDFNPSENSGKPLLKAMGPERLKLEKFMTLRKNYLESLRGESEAARKTTPTGQTP